MLLDKPRRDFRDRHRVLKVLLHEPFDRSLSGRPGDATLFRDPQLIIASQHILWFARGEMQPMADRGDVLMRHRQPQRVFGTQSTSNFSELISRFRSVRHQSIE